MSVCFFHLYAEIKKKKVFSCAFCIGDRSNYSFCEINIKYYKQVKHMLIKNFW